jgi:hypothetical protein
MAGLKQETSPLGMCFRGVLNRLVNDANFQWAERELGANLSFVVESGHKNSKDVEHHFDTIKKMDPKRFGTLRFEDKKAHIALQAADFIAFYSRRIRNSAFALRPRLKELELFQRTLGSIKHRPFLATDFAP